jgi:hypothetical protein
MITFWVQKGRLQGDDGTACAPASGHCAFVAKMPKSYSVKAINHG